ncbi:MAG: DUF3572 family protein [Polymorphobacter sp.]|uniref:DUF3572 family protein n=1 Tax=Polymorphobacter sp. TaxID=1909290 RepID=UPI003A89B959
MLRAPAPTLPADDVLALQALAATIGCDDLGPRFLALTGLDAEGLRARAAEPALLAELIAFLAAHEASLTRIAGELGVAPAALVAAGQRLAR